MLTDLKHLLNHTVHEHIIFMYHLCYGVCLQLPLLETELVISENADGMQQCVALAIRHRCLYITTAFNWGYLAFV